MKKDRFLLFIETLKTFYIRPNNVMVKLYAVSIKAIQKYK